LRARNDELRAENEQWRTDWLNMQAENERLAHQVAEHEKSLAIAYQYRSESDAEIEQLRGELHRVAESRRGQRERAERAEAESEQLRQENAKLREEVEDDTEDPDGWGFFQ